MSFSVHLARYAGIPLIHHALFVYTGEGHGNLFHVKGNIIDGMVYDMEKGVNPKSAAYIDMTHIGWVDSSDLERVESICKANPPPAKQYNGSRRINPEVPFRRAQHWVAETIQLLKEAGVLKPKASRPSGSHSGTSGGAGSLPNQEPIDGQTTPDGY